MIMVCGRRRPMTITTCCWRLCLTRQHATQVMWGQGPGVLTAWPGRLPSSTCRRAPVCA